MKQVNKFSILGVILASVLACSAVQAQAGNVADSPESARALNTGSPDADHSETAYEREYDQFGTCLRDSFPQVDDPGGGSRSKYGQSAFSSSGASRSRTNSAFVQPK